MSKIETPNMMNISVLSQIQERLNFLAQAITNEKEAELQTVTIQCSNVGGINVVKLIHAIGISTSVTTINKKSGALLPYDITVNLYDLYSFVKNADDEMVFWIDEDTNELVCNSYYNELADYEELEVRLPILNKNKEIKLKIPFDNQTPIAEFTLQAIGAFSILKELNVRGEVEKFDVRFSKDGVSFESEVNGLDVALTLKELDNVKSIRDITARIPFSMFKLISASGEYKGMNFKFYPGYVYVKTEAYLFSFEYENIETESGFKSTESLGFEDAFYIDLEVLFHSLRIINQINLPSKEGTIVIEKVDSGTADVTTVYPGRYSISTRIQLAMLTDEQITINGPLFYEMFDKLGVDAVCIKYLSSNGKLPLLYNFVENAIIKKKILFNPNNYKK